MARELTALIKTARQARHDRLGQWDRVHLERHVRSRTQDNRVVWAISLRRESRCRIGFCESFKRAHARRASQREPVPRPRSCPDQDHELGRRLQLCDGRDSGAGLSHTGGLCRQSLRNKRSAAQSRPAPPIACCSNCARRRKIRRDSNCLPDESSGWSRSSPLRMPRDK